MKKNELKADKKPMKRQRFKPDYTIKKFIPFFQLNPETATIDDFLNAGDGCILYYLADNPGDDPSETDIIKHVKKIIKNHGKEVLNHLKETLIGAQKMIYIATINHNLSKQEIKDIEENFMDKSLSRSTYWSNWKGPTEASIFPISDAAWGARNWKEMVEGFRCWVVWAIVDVFSSREDSPSLGSIHFSACPTCRKIFEKKRKDQMFCSKPCSGVHRQRKYQAKKQK